MCCSHTHPYRCRRDPIDPTICQCVRSVSRCSVALESLTLFVPGETPAVGEGVSTVAAVGCSEVRGKVGSPSRPIPRIFCVFWVRCPGQVSSPAGRTKTRVSLLAQMHCSGSGLLIHACYTSNCTQRSVPLQRKCRLLLVDRWFEINKFQCRSLVSRRAAITRPSEPCLGFGLRKLARCKAMYLWSGVVLDGG
jgi:hypothetical protein